MYATKKTAKRREAFTLIELLVVMAIIVVIAALAAAFAPNVSDSQNLTRSVDQLEQWLLTAKMRAKRDQLATGLRFISIPGSDAANTYSQFQYIQQPDPLSGGWVSAMNSAGAVPYNGMFLSGGICLPTPSAAPPVAASQVMFGNVDFTMGMTLLPNQYLVQAGDYLEVRDGGVYLITGVVATSPTNMIQLGGTGYQSSLTITAPTTNYRILRQPRILIGEAPVNLPTNFAVDFNVVPGTVVAGGNVQLGPNGIYPEILFSPTGAIVGTNVGSGKVFMIVHDMTIQPYDITRAGVVAVQSRTGFIGAYSVAPGADPFAFAEGGRESGL